MLEEREFGGVESLLGEVMEVGFGVRVEERDVLGYLVEERRAVVLEGGEGLLEVDLELGLFGRWENCGILVVHFTFFFSLPRRNKRENRGSGFLGKGF